MSRRLKMIGLFRRISSLLQGSFAKETYNFKEPTSGSHPITEYQLTSMRIRIYKYNGKGISTNGCTYTNI